MLKQQKSNSWIPVSPIKDRVTSPNQLNWKVLGRSLHLVWGPTRRRVIKEGSKVVNRDWVNPQACIEPRHDKTNKVSVRPAKTQISLGICPIWSESSLSAWRKLGSLATHLAHSKDSDQTGRMPRLIWVFAGRTLILLGLSCRGSFVPEKQFCFLNSLMVTTELETLISAVATELNREVIKALKHY